jgi:2'-5' RNA ligase
LGRVKAPAGLHSLLAELEAARNADFGTMTVRAVTFFQSVLKPTGAEYTPLSVFVLS